MKLTPNQLSIIEQQLGRKPRGLVRIAAFSKDIPLVLQMRSLIEDKPFPTLYWLSSKTLNKAIGQIEGQGWVKTIERRLMEDESLRNIFLANQQSYTDSRWNKVAPKDKTRIATLGFTELFKQYGIGGITEWQKVRCLHMQYAHHLAEKNIIGELMDEEFGLNKLEIMA